MPNTNCLEGMQCPECKSFEPFKIDVMVTATVYDNGTDDTSGDTEWDDQSRCECGECGHVATVAEFETHNERPALYIMEPIGVDGQLEATDTLWFCSEDCRNVIVANTEHKVMPGMNAEYDPGTVCDECGEELCKTN